MNYDDMQAGPEMDQLVGIKCTDFESVYIRNDKCRCIRRLVNNAHDDEQTWSPSTNIIHAMDAVAAMRHRKNNWFTLNWYGDCEEWHAGQGDGTMDWPGKAPTAPLAICRALLKAATL